MLSTYRRALADSHNDVVESIEGSPVTDLQLLQELHEQVRIADAIYEPTVDRLASKSRNEPMLASEPRM